MDNIIKEIIIIAGVLFGTLSTAALLVWVERRMLGAWQDRYGPNRVGPFGIFQIVADIIKLLFKEDWIAPFAEKTIYFIIPGVIVATVFMSFAVIPFTSGIIVADLNIGIFVFLAMSSLGVYSIVLGGWASNSKYSLIGAMRGAAQMITYEVFMGLSLMGVIMMSGSVRLIDIVEAQRNIWFCFPQIIGFITFLIAGLAETRRIPFDIPEAENELVAGYHTEYSGMKFGLFFLGEYLGIVLISSLIVVFFFGGWLGPSFLPAIIWFLIKMFIFVLLFILFRAALPRVRYDQLMSFGWKVMFPLALLNMAVTGAILLARTPSF